MQAHPAQGDQAEPRVDQLPDTPHDTGREATGRIEPGGRERYLSWKAREYDFATRFIELAGEINTAMPRRPTRHLFA